MDLRNIERLDFVMNSKTFERTCSIIDNSALSSQLLTQAIQIPTSNMHNNDLFPSSKRGDLYPILRFKRFLTPKYPPKSMHSSIMHTHVGCFDYHDLIPSLRQSTRQTSYVSRKNKSMHIFLSVFFAESMLPITILFSFLPYYFINSYRHKPLMWKVDTNEARILLLS